MPTTGVPSRGGRTNPATSSDMAFQASPSDAVKPPRVELRSVSKTTFELMTPFAYVSAAGEVIPVPAHPNEWATDTDLASVPPLLWGLLASYGRQLRAAIFHDHLCDKVNRAVENGDDQAYASRRHADNLFREAMRDKGDGSDEDLQKRVPWFRSWLFWAGVASVGTGSSARSERCSCRSKCS